MDAMIRAARARVAVVLSMPTGVFVESEKRIRNALFRVQVRISKYRHVRKAFMICDGNWVIDACFSPLRAFALRTVRNYLLDETVRSSHQNNCPQGPEIPDPHPSQGIQILIHTPLKSYDSECDLAAGDDSSPALMNTPHQPTWRVASAAVNHMTGNRGILTGFKPVPGDPIVHVAANMAPMRVHGRGSVDTPNVVLQDVWYVPGLEMNLISAGQLTKLGHKVSFGPSGCHISKGSDDNVVGKARFTDEFQFEVEFLKVPSAN